MTYTCSFDLEDARAMDRADRELRAASRRDFGGPRWHQAGIACLREAFKRTCLDRLNALAELLDNRTQLSERSIDELFESSHYTDVFVQQLRLEAQRDPQFEADLRAEFGDRIFTRELNLKQESLF